MKKIPTTISIKWFTLSSSKGFTLIESLLAIFIFSLSLVSLITLSSRGITGTVQARDQAIAQFLAQEGIEMVRHTRDNQFIMNPPGTWFTTQLANCQENSPCIIDGYNSPYFNLVSNTNDYGLLVQNDKYQPVSVSSGKFVREIYVDSLNSDEIVVHSVVSWNNGSIPRQVHLTTNLTNWIAP